MYNLGNYFLLRSLITKEVVLVILRIRTVSTHTARQMLHAMIHGNIVIDGGKSTVVSG